MQTVPMTPILRATGTTNSERYLASLAERSFLNLWSYPNVFIDKKVRGKGDGKELCDLLVVCGDDVLIFSDKTIAWPSGDDVNLGWQRWFKRSVLQSADQIRGAARWIEQFPDRIYIDRSCTQRLPIALPPNERRRVHGIVVALGAGKACQEFFGGDSGSLMIVPDLIGDDHIKPDAEHYTPFAIGDLDPRKPFVHVLDDTTLDIVMKELDTVTDFTRYLRKKEAFIRSGHLLIAPGDEELLAYYMKCMNAAHEHDFVKEDGSPWKPGDRVTLHTGIYEDLLKHPQYLAKKAADTASYSWDTLIGMFTKNMLEGTTVVIEGKPLSLAEAEEGVRHMALAPRYARRLYAQGIMDVLEKSPDHDRFARAFMPGPTEERDTAFVFMTVKIPKIELTGGYEQYRKVRCRMLYGYALNVLVKAPKVKRVVGIAMEPRRKPGQPKGSSEDLVLVERPASGDELAAEAAEYAKTFDIMQEGRVIEYAARGNEYPEIPRLPVTPFAGRGGGRLNRHQRRRLAAEARKGR